MVAGQAFDFWANDRTDLRYFGTYRLLKVAG